MGNIDIYSNEEGCSLIELIKYKTEGTVVKNSKNVLLSVSWTMTDEHHSLNVWKFVILIRLKNWIRNWTSLLLIELCFLHLHSCIWQTHLSKATYNAYKTLCAPIGNHTHKLSMLYKTLLFYLICKLWRKNFYICMKSL